MSTATPTPRQVFERLLAAITSRPRVNPSELYAEDALVLLPFNLPEPLRLEGRAQLHARFAATAELPFELEPRNVVIHETQDPEVIVAEFEYHGRMIDTDRTFDVANVVVMRVRNGQIVESHDYHHHARLAEFLGAHPELAAAPAT